MWGRCREALPLPTHVHSNLIRSTHQSDNAHAFMGIHTHMCPSKAVVFMLTVCSTASSMANTSTGIVCLTSVVSACCSSCPPRRWHYVLSSARTHLCVTFVHRLALSLSLSGLCGCAAHRRLHTAVFSCQQHNRCLPRLTPPTPPASPDDRPRH